MRVLSLFDGMSCGQIALRELGVIPEVYYASEIDKHAIGQTQLNFPDTIQLGDVTRWPEWDIDWQSIDLIFAGSPCFVAGTKIITTEGYKNIEDIKVGDMVLTHNGRFREVLCVGGSIKETIELKTQGMLPTITTYNHPYYVRKMSRVWNNSRRSSERCFSEPEWIEPGKIKNDDFIGLPIISTIANPENITSEEAFVIGRYIADGHTRKDFRTSENRPSDRHWQIIISVGYEKMEQFRADVKLKFSCYKHSQSTFRCIFSNKRMVEIVEKYCGCNASGKRLSPMILNLPIDLLREVIRGYFSGDGSFRKGVYRATTISRELAMSLCLAIAKAYRVNANIEYTSRPSKCQIKGRTVNQSDTYTVSFRDEIKKQSQAVVIDDIIWMRAKSVCPTGKIQSVYNLEVAEDNSYTANNVIVHNCQGFSFAGKQLAFNDPRSKLFFVFIDILNHCRKHNPGVLFLLENVNMKKSHLRVISEYCGVFPVRINSALVSAQNRDRWYWTNIRTRQEGLFGEIHSDIPQPADRGILLKDILEDEVDEKYYLSDKIVETLLKHAERQKENKTGFAKVFHSPEQKMGALKVGGAGADDLVMERCAGVSITERGLRPYKDDGHRGSMSEFGTISFTNQKSDALTTQHEPKIMVHNTMPRSSKNGNGGTGRLTREDGKTYCLDTGQTNAVEFNQRIRRLTPTECSRLQTIPDWYRWECSDTQIYRMLGNGWTVEVIKHILSFLPKKFTA